MVDHKKSTNVVKWNVSLSLMVRTTIMCKTLLNQKSRRESCSQKGTLVE